jgi:hypothetical protein
MISYNLWRRYLLPVIRNVTTRETQRKVTSSCTQVCGDKESASKSCAKTLPLYVYPKGKPEIAQKVYALIDDQSTHTLATPILFDRLGGKCGTNKIQINRQYMTCQVFQVRMISYNLWRRYLLPVIRNVTTLDNRGNIYTDTVIQRFDNII